MPWSESVFISYISSVPDHLHIELEDTIIELWYLHDKKGSQEKGVRNADDWYT